jgi:hypothetical protein
MCVCSSVCDFVCAIKAVAHVCVCGHLTVGFLFSPRVLTHCALAPSCVCVAVCASLSPCPLPPSSSSTPLAAGGEAECILPPPFPLPPLVPDPPFLRSVVVVVTAVDARVLCPSPPPLSLPFLLPLSPFFSVCLATCIHIRRLGNEGVTAGAQQQEEGKVDQV